MSNTPVRSPKQPSEQLRCEGVRVILTEDWGFFDKGDAGTIVGYDPETGLFRVWFDGGAEQDFPAAMLAREVGGFRCLDQRAQTLERMRER